MYKKAVASFWTVEEVDLSHDLRDWDRLTGQYQGLVPFKILLISLSARSRALQMKNGISLNMCLLFLLLLMAL
jgi:ribonucleotide reductase beta subunit family protein with ferritin-like domain